MPWCPKCKNEYYEGIKVCADCGCELADSLEEIEEAEQREKEAFRLEQMAMLRKMAAMEDGTLDTADEDPEKTEDAVSGGKADGKVQEFGEELKDGADSPGKQTVAENEVADKGAADKKVDISHGVYQNYAERAADNKSSAYTLLGIGTVGLLAVILTFCDVIRLPLSESSKFLTMGVMGAVFLLFVVMGVISMKNAGKYAKKAGSEKELTKELEKWLAEYVTAEIVDTGLFSEEEADFSEEQKYFKRFDKMKTMLSERFLNLDDGYMNRFLDEHYQDVFEER